MYAAEKTERDSRFLAKEAHSAAHSMDVSLEKVEFISSLVFLVLLLGLRMIAYCCHLSEDKPFFFLSFFCCFWRNTCWHDHVVLLAQIYCLSNNSRLFFEQQHLETMTHKNFLNKFKWLNPHEPSLGFLGILLVTFLSGPCLFYLDYRAVTCGLFDHGVSLLALLAASPKLSSSKVDSDWRVGFLDEEGDGCDLFCLFIDGFGDSLPSGIGNPKIVTCPGKPSLY